MGAFLMCWACSSTLSWKPWTGGVVRIIYEPALSLPMNLCQGQKSAKVILGFNNEPSDRMETLQATEGPNGRVTKELGSLWQSAMHRTHWTIFGISGTPEAECPERVLGRTMQPARTRWVLFYQAVVYGPVRWRCEGAPWDHIFSRASHSTKNQYSNPTRKVEFRGYSKLQRNYIIEHSINIGAAIRVPWKSSATGRMLICINLNSDAQMA